MKSIKVELKAPKKRGGKKFQILSGDLYNFRSLVVKRVKSRSLVAKREKIKIPSGEKFPMKFP